MFQISTIKFLKDLKKNNNKPWFDAKPQSIRSSQKQILLSLLMLLFRNMERKILPLHTSKQRIVCSASTVMFASVKTRARTKTIWEQVSTRVGKKSMTAGYYFHLQPGESFTGGGLYMAMPDQLKKHPPGN